jgi:hypothetical protein
MKRVYATPNSAEAAMIQGLLDENGIAALVVDDDLAGMTGFVAPSTMPSVWVIDDADAERAEALIAEHAPADDDEDPGEETDPEENDESP